MYVKIRVTYKSFNEFEEESFFVWFRGCWMWWASFGLELEDLVFRFIEFLVGFEVVM